MGTPRCGCLQSKQGKQEKGGLTSHGRRGPNAPEVLVLPPQSHLVLPGEKGAESCGARPPVARGQPGDVGTSRLEIRRSPHRQGSSLADQHGHGSPWWITQHYPAGCSHHPSVHLLPSSPLAPKEASARPGGSAGCHPVPHPEGWRGHRVAGGMARTCRRLSEPTEAAGLSLASSPNADKSPWASSRSGGVTTEPKGGDQALPPPPRSLSRRGPRGSCSAPARRHRPQRAPGDPARAWGGSPPKTIRKRLNYPSG